MPFLPASGGGGAAAEIVDAGNLGASYTFALAGRKNVWLVGTLTANCTITVTGLSEGAAVQMFLTQDATGSRTLTVSDGTDSTAVTVTSTATALTMVSGWSTDGTTIVLAAAGGFVPTDFDPSTVAGLHAWYDATEITGLSNGDPVATWTDSSGNARNATQGTSGNRPVYVASGINALPSVNFASSKLLVASGVSVTQPDTIFAVVDAASDPAATNPFDGDSARQALAVSTGKWALYAGSGPAEGTVAADTNAHVISCLFNGASSTIRVDGVAAGTVNAGTDALTGLKLGGFDVGVANFPGLIGELLIYEGSVSAGDRTDIEAYLMTKWGV